MDPIHVYNYLHGEAYPEHASNGLKRSIRRTAKDNYKLEGDDLLYKVNKKEMPIPADSSDSSDEGQQQNRTNTITWRKVLLTEEERTELITKIHTKDGHLGSSKTISRIQKRYFWPNYTKDIKSFTSTCHQCQLMNKKRKNTAPPMVPVVVPHARPWHQLGIDLISMEPSKQGNKYICTVVDYFTKYASAKPLQTKSAEGVGQYLFELMMIFGFPGVLISDQGREFCNQLVETLLKATGTDHRVTSAYHPQANGMTERFNQTIQNMMRKTLDGCTNKDWEDVLQSCVFAYNTSEHGSTKYAPYFLMFGVEPRIATDLDDLGDEARAPSQTTEQHLETRIRELIELNAVVRPKSLGNIEQAQGTQKQYYDRRHEEEGYEVGQKVLKKNLRKADRKGGKTENKFIGPYTIRAKAKGKGTYLLTDMNGKTLKKAVHAMHLKVYKERNGEPGTSNDQGCSAE